MSYHIKVFSDLNPDFQKIIAISPESTFLDLHHIICKSLKLDDKQLSSFYLCDKNWMDELEITLEDMAFDDNAFTPLMINTTLEEQLILVGQKIRYVNDYVLMNEVKLEFIEQNGVEKKGTSLPAVIFEEGEIQFENDLSALLDDPDEEIIQKLKMENFDRFHSLEDDSKKGAKIGGFDLEGFDEDDLDDDEEGDDFGFGDFDDWGGGRKGGRDDDY